MKRPIDHALGLLSKAANDHVAAEATLATGQALDMVCYHAQQIAEKSLKALLAAKDVVYPWTHNLGELLKLVNQHYPMLILSEEEIVQLSPYAVELRYDEDLCPDLDETRCALKASSELLAKVKQIIGLNEVNAPESKDGNQS